MSSYDTTEAAHHGGPTAEVRRHDIDKGEDEEEEGKEMGAVGKSKEA